MTGEIIYNGRGDVKQVQPVEQEDKLRERLLKERNGVVEAESIARALDIGVDVVKEAIEQMRDEGYGVAKRGETYIRTNMPRGGKVYDASGLVDGQVLRFAIGGDTHLASEKERLDALNSFYDICQHEGVRAIFHPGDLTEGVNVYRGQELEVKEIGQERQIKYAIENYPLREGVTTFAITGNHDLREYERGGVDPLVAISRARPDIVYLGQISAMVDFAPRVRMEMLHPGGGVAYALSYKAQRDINNRTPDELPEILVYGHYHTSFYMRYRGIHFLQAPCFKDQGIFEKRLGLNPTIGGWIVEAKLSDQGIERFRPELFTF